jgi:hypothetical protein
MLAALKAMPAERGSAITAEHVDGEWPPCGRQHWQQAVFLQLGRTELLLTGLYRQQQTIYSSAMVDHSNVDTPT